MRITNFILSFMFLLFAVVQYNDPDPLIWISIYMYAAILCFLAGTGRYYKSFILAGVVVSFVWALTLAASILVAVKNYGTESIVSLSMVKNNEVEEAREALGLVIVSIVLFWKYFEKHTKK